LTTASSSSARLVRKSSLRVSASAGADWARRQLRHQLLQNFAATRGVSARDVVLGCRDRPRLAQLHRLQRRQPECVFEQQRRGFRRAPSRSRAGRLLDRERDSPVRRLRAEREVASTVLLVLKHLGQQAVQLPSPRRRRVGVERRCKQWMGEADPLPVNLDQAGADGAIEIAQDELRNRCLQQRQRRTRQRRRRQHRLVRRAIGSLQALAHRVGQRRRDVESADVELFGVQFACDRQRIQRIAA
jgi:hypothetical protein